MVFLSPGCWRPLRSSHGEGIKVREDFTRTYGFARKQYPTAG